jgi:hypothetical protein
MITPRAHLTKIYIAENLFYPFTDFEISETNALILRGFSIITNYDSKLIKKIPSKNKKC